MGRSILDGILARVGPRAASPSLDGETREAFLLDLASVFSQFWDERRAIEISRYVLTNAGLPLDVSRISDYLQNTPSSHKYANRFAVQLGNLSVRRCKLAFFAALGGDLGTARDQLDQAFIEGQQSFQLRQDTNRPWVISGRLVSRAHLARVELERAALLIADLDERAEALEEVERTVTAILIESYEAAYVLPRERLIQLGMVLLEQACIWEKRGDAARAESLASIARIVMKTNRDVFKIDADEPLESAVRYGETCRLSGAIPVALSAWRRGRERLALFRGADSSAVKALDERIQALQ